MSKYNPRIHKVTDLRTGMPSDLDVGWRDTHDLVLTSLTRLDMLAARRRARRIRTTVRRIRALNAPWPPYHRSGRAL